VFGKVGSYGGDRDVDLFQHPPRRDPQGADSSLRHPGVPDRVAFRLIALPMDIAVDFDRQARRRAEEVEDVGAHRMLSTEAQAVELGASQG